MRFPNRRQNLLPDTYKEDKLAPPPFRAGARASRLSLARSVASTGSLPSILSANSMGFLEGPQSVGALSVYPSVCLSAGRSVYLSICLSIYRSVCLSVCLSFGWSVGRLSICLSAGWSVCRLHGLSACLSVCLSVCLSIDHSVVCFSVCLFVGQSVCLLVSRLVCLSVCLSVGRSADQSLSQSVCRPVSLCLFVPTVASGATSTTTTHKTEEEESLFGLIRPFKPEMILSGLVCPIFFKTNLSFLSPQIFEFFAGLESDKYPFGLGDICVMQPKCAILITYLTSDLLRVFPWRGESPAFVSQPLGCTLCCITQLSNETVAVTSSNSDQLSFMKVNVYDFT